MPVNRSKGRRGALVAAAATAVVAAGLQAGASTATAVVPPTDCSTVPWMDTSKTPEERAQALLDASTLDQKLRWLDEQSANDPTRTQFQTSRPRELPPNVPFTPIPFTMPVQVPCTPTIQYTDAPSLIVGAGAGVTVYPVNVSLSASWDLDLAYEKGEFIAHEAWRKQRNVLLGPGLASGRDPRSGRTSEYLGEDQVLAGLMAGAYSRGVGANDAEPVQAQLKHFVANEQEIDRNNSSSNVDPRTLREIYTLPFEIAIDRGDVGSVMCAFNQVNHEWSCGSEELLAADPQDRDRLRRLGGHRLRRAPLPHRRPAVAARGPRPGAQRLALLEPHGDQGPDRAGPAHRGRRRRCRLPHRPRPHRLRHLRRAADQRAGPRRVDTGERGVRPRARRARLGAAEERRAAAAVGLRRDDRRHRTDGDGDGRPGRRGRLGCLHPHAAQRPVHPGHPRCRGSPTAPRRPAAR